ncbi:SRPBCC family protein [Halomonas sp. 18H]|uniref:SRPBCC family protein n=1 Tax=Halomonas almeriensis TaxID=308163 RepID=UPI00223266F7|nr:MULTISPECIES: SRPBCC family protein [Halomonas]MCW4151763.1 SRPBCC family protein [Halomonas sp. 18H]MDN3554009.1 SRPBCC family protein [Halomonas almeriensis]
MARIEHSATLHAPPERVFALLERVEDFVDYSDLIKDIEPLGNDHYRWHVRAVGMDWTFDVAITESVAPSVLAWESVDGVHNTGRYELAQVPEGTRVALRVDYEIHNRFVEKAVRRAASPLVNRVSQQILDRVAARLHAGE